MSIFDSDYVQQQQVLNLQNMAAQQNALRIQNYNQSCTDWITVNLRNRELGLPLSLVPTVPKKITVDDKGDWTEAPFDNLAAPVLPAPVVNTSTGALRATVGVPPDRIDQIIAILNLLNSKLDTLLSRAVAAAH